MRQPHSEFLRLEAAAFCTAAEKARRLAARRAVPFPPGAEVVASMPAGGTGGVGIGAGSVWVIDRTSGVLRIDPTRNTQVAKIERVLGGVHRGKRLCHP